MTRSALERIEHLNGRLKAFAHVSAEQALEAARVAEREFGRGEHRGLLHGIPVGINDLIEVAGLPLEAGSAVMRGCVAARDAAVVTRLKEAGSIIIGKTSLDEFALTTLGPAEEPAR